MTQKEAASCINTIELFRRLAYNVHGLMDVIDAENCEKIIGLLNEQAGNESGRETGHWISKHSQDARTWECSECGYRVNLEDGGIYHYCSACGVGMEDTECS